MFAGPARRNSPRAFCFQVPPIGRRRRRRDATSSLFASARARRRPTHFRQSDCFWPARANVPVGGPRHDRRDRRGPLLLRDRVRARNDRADRDHAAHFLARRAMHDCVSGIARARGPVRARHLGAIVVSADIIRFIPRPKSHREPTDFPTIAFRSTVRSDELARDHDDTAPCEYAPCPSQEDSDETSQHPPEIVI
jgi:hypothetical protein